MGNSQGKPVDLNGEGELNPHVPHLVVDCSKISISSGTILCKFRLHRSRYLLASSFALSVPHSSLLTIGNPRHAVNLNHFRLLRVVGRGAFGKVRIVERKDTGLSFALKYIRKDEGACSALGHDPPPSCQQTKPPNQQLCDPRVSETSYENGACSSM